MSDIEQIGNYFIRQMFGKLEFDVTEYCNAAVDAGIDYCIQEFKKACNMAGITWQKKWENILND